MTADTRILGFAASMLMVAGVADLGARDVTVQPLDLGRTGELRLIDGSISGYEMVDYEVTGQASQILYVDMLASNPSAYFNISKAGADEAVFIGSTQGNVANVPLPQAGSYLVRVYLVRAAARRGETAEYSLAVSLGPPDFADGLAGGPDYWRVSGVGGNAALNLRDGPSTRYPVIGIFRNGDVLQNRGCRLTGQERWCRIRATGTGLTGWVAGRYLVETAPPRLPAVPEGGPVGNGTPFDATGYVACATLVGEHMRQCPFGVIRQGPGNAGVWIALGDGRERHLLFEAGRVVAADSADAMEYEKSGDLFRVRVGDERYEIVGAVVDGG